MEQAGSIPLVDGTSMEKRDRAVRAAMVANADAVAMRVLDKLLEASASRIMQAAANVNQGKPDLVALDDLASRMAKAAYVIVDHVLGERESYIHGMMAAMEKVGEVKTGPEGQA